jgi:hypothetical protein
MNKKSQRNLFTSLDPDPLTTKINLAQRSLPVSSLSNLIKEPPLPGEFNETIETEVTKKYNDLVASTNKEVVYYILGPVTDYDRAFIKKILDNDKTIHVFIQGGIELTKGKIWSTTLLGAVPANAGMDFESFYDFFETGHREKMKVYVQFTNMAKGIPSNELGRLWIGTEMKQFITDLEKNNGGTMFAKIWETYYRSAGAAAAWQHDPIEVINSLFQLSGNEYEKIVDKGRYVTYDRTDNKNGLITQGPPTRQDGDKRIFAKLLDHDLEDEDYKKAQELRFKQFVRLLRQSFGMNAQIMPRSILANTSQNKFEEGNSELTPLSYMGGKLSVLDNSDAVHDVFVTKMIAAYSQKYLPFISIEILDPDNNFAAKLIDHISGNRAHVFVHSQFYPVNVRSFAGIPDAPKDMQTKMINMMNVPKELITTDITDKLGFIPPKTSDVNITVYYDGENHVKQYGNIMNFAGFPPPPKVLELLCGKTFGENHNKYVNCSDAEINFMRKLLQHDRVYLGQPLYGYKNTDFTFTSRGLLHPVSLFICNNFTGLGSSKDFVENVFQKVSGTAFEFTDRGLLENYRTECLKSWISAFKPITGGGRKSKKRRTTRRKTRKSKSRR